MTFYDDNPDIQDLLDRMRRRLNAKGKAAFDIANELGYNPIDILGGYDNEKKKDIVDALDDTDTMVEAIVLAKLKIR